MVRYPFKLHIENQDNSLLLGNLSLESVSS